MGRRGHDAVEWIRREEYRNQRRQEREEQAAGAAEGQGSSAMEGFALLRAGTGKLLEARIHNA